MPTQDVTGRVVTRASEFILKMRTRIDEAIPLGPDKVEVTPKELRKTYDQMTPEERMTFATAQGGIEDAMEMMDVTP